MPRSRSCRPALGQYIYVLIESLLMMVSFYYLVLPILLYWAWTRLMFVSPSDTYPQKSKLPKKFYCLGKIIFFTHKIEAVSVNENHMFISVSCFWTVDLQTGIMVNMTLKIFFLTFKQMVLNNTHNKLWIRYKNYFWIKHYLIYLPRKANKLFK
jgi:hypothetical protein